MQHLNAYQGLHAKGHFPGVSLLQYVPRLAELVAEFKSKTVFDYGCGKGLQYTKERAHFAIGVEMPTCYDPAVDKFRHLPPRDLKFDGVICTDVVEHIPEGELAGTLEILSRHAGQWCFISVCCRPAKSLRFADGSNIHVTIKPFAWWQDLTRPYFTKARLVLVESP
jgi:hypothetical protein